MIDPDETGRAFDAALRERAPALSVRPEADEDEAFLRALFLATFQLRDVLPAPMLAQQADLHFGALSNNYRGAMRRIVLEGGAPIGRLIIDWSGQTSHCVDIAVHPDQGGRGVGTALLQAWIDTATDHGLACTLEVAPVNPARRLYARLGFLEAPDQSAAASIEMTRPLPP